MFRYSHEELGCSLSHGQWVYKEELYGEKKVEEGKKVTFNLSKKTNVTLKCPLDIALDPVTLKESNPKDF